VEGLLDAYYGVCGVCLCVKCISAYLGTVFVFCAEKMV
jgi:hypothetical protein